MNENKCGCLLVFKGENKIDVTLIGKKIKFSCRKKEVRSLHCGKRCMLGIQFKGGDLGAFPPLIEMRRVNVDNIATHQ